MHTPIHVFLMWRPKGGVRFVEGETRVPWEEKGEGGKEEGQREGGKGPSNDEE